MIATPWYRHYSKYRSYFSNSFNSVKSKDELKAYLEILLSLATIIIFSVFALKPTLITIAKLYKDIAYKTDIVSKMDAKIDNLKLAQEFLNKESLSLSFLSQAVSDGAEPDILYRQFEGLNKDQNAQITYFRLGKSDLTRNLTTSEGKIGFSFSMTADFPTILDYIQSVERIRKQITLSSITISTESLSKLGDEKGLTVTVQGDSNYLN